MTSCPTLSFACSVVRRTLVIQLLLTQHASLCAALAKEDVELDKAVHYLPDYALFAGSGYFHANDKQICMDGFMRCQFNA